MEHEAHNEEHHVRLAPPHHLSDLIVDQSLGTFWWPSRGCEGKKEGGQVGQMRAEKIMNFENEENHVRLAAPPHLSDPIVD